MAGPDSTPENNGPFFVVGSGRCGTTLVQVCLEAHPRIAIPPEGHVFSRFSSLLPEYGELSDAKNLSYFVKDFLGDYYIRRWRLDFSPKAFCDALPERSFRGCLELAYGRYAKRLGKERWGDKTPVHVLLVHKIKAVFPKAKFIHVVRDGRDVAESLQRVWFAPKDILGNAAYWRKRVMAFSEAKRFLRPDDYIEVRYEDFVRNPDGEAARMFAFLGEEPIAMGHRVPDSLMKEWLTSRSDLQQMLLEPISERKVGIYRTAFSRREIEIFETVAKDALVHYGYDFDTPGEASLSVRERCQFFMKRGAFRIGRVGNRYYLSQHSQGQLRKLRLRFRAAMRRGT